MGETLSIEPLDYEKAKQSSVRLTELVNLIPEVKYVEEDVLAVEKTDGRQLKDKWSHSYIAIEKGELVGVILGYLRNAENNEIYPDRTFYIGEIAVDESARGRGIARDLLKKYHEGCMAEAETLGIGFSVQTNAAEWNNGVRAFYESFGYNIVSLKQYDNRTDVVMRATVEEVKKALNENYVN
ncbi:GNAT family N-acetyltransferase [Candidatus Saccharibacteria bacterium]|nr:GNAT family N-acetyltransferase [Candidatus Saccharibacteria bacterium]